MQKLAEWVGRSSVARKAATLVAPRRFFRAVMHGQRGFGPHCSLSFDCDFPRDIQALPDLARLLDRFQVVASFACIGRWVREFPQPHRELVTAGHEIINHTETHPNLYHPGYDYARGDDLSRLRFNEISEADRRTEIESGHSSIAEVLRVEPTGFRTPHFGQLHVDDIYPILHGMGYTFSSSVLAASPDSGGLPYRTPLLWEFPVSPCPDHPFGVFDSWHALGKVNASHARPGELAGLFRIAGDKVQEDGGYLNIYLDPKVCVESGELLAMLEYLRDNRIEPITYAALAELLDERPDAVAESA